MTLDRRIVGLAICEFAGFGALAILVFYLPLPSLAKIPDVWSTDRVVVYILLFFGALFIFLPFSLLLRLGPVWLLGAGSWALLGYTLIFVGPPGRQQVSFVTYAAFLALVYVALSAALALPLCAISKKVLPPATPTLGVIRSVRQGALLALFTVTLLAMSPLGVLNWLNAFLVFTIVALTEFFFVARD